MSDSAIGVVPIEPNAVRARYILEPMVAAAAAGHARTMQIRTPNERFLCDYDDAGEWHQLWAVLDELTLTYSVLVRAPDGSSRAVRRHVASLRDARTWAGGYRDRQVDGRARACTALVFGATPGV